MRIDRPFPASLAGSLVALTLVLGATAGCALHVGPSGVGWYKDGSTKSSAAKYKGEKKISVKHVQGSRVVVESPMGSVKIRRADIDRVLIRAVIRARTPERLDETDVYTKRRDDGSLRIATRWPGNKRGKNESCSFDIRVPDAHGVEVETAFGAITLVGLEGPAELVTSYGAIRAEQHEGPVRARTSFGAVDLINVGGTVDADTSYGSVEIRLTDENPGPVNVATSFGGVELVPGRAFRGTIDMDTSFGSVKIVGAETTSMPLRRVETRGKSNARIVIGEEETERSRIGTSYGGITVSLPRDV